MSTLYLTARKYSQGYFIYFTGTSNLVAIYYNNGNIELSDGSFLRNIPTLKKAKIAILNSLNKSN